MGRGRVSALPRWRGRPKSFLILAPRKASLTYRRPACVAKAIRRVGAGGRRGKRYLCRLRLRLHPRATAMACEARAHLSSWFAVGLSLAPDWKAPRRSLCRNRARQRRDARSPAELRPGAVRLDWRNGRWAG